MPTSPTANGRHKAVPVHMKNSTTPDVIGSMALPMPCMAERTTCRTYSAGRNTLMIEIAQWKIQNIPNPCLAPYLEIPFGYPERHRVLAGFQQFKCAFVRPLGCKRSINCPIQQQFSRIKSAKLRHSKMDIQVRYSSWNPLKQFL